MNNATINTVVNGLRAVHWQYGTAETPFPTFIYRTEFIKHKMEIPILYKLC